ncbi:MAG: ABC transporter permease [Planctomycetes bacterium]|nr:ABC transporter permease [Planctomycetota bacterium]
MDTLLVALRSLRAHPLRSALTLVGIVIGIMAVVGMSALIRGVDEVIMGSIRTMNPHVVYLTKMGLVMTPEQWIERRKRPDITMEDLRAIEADCSTVGRLDPIVEDRAELTREDRRTRGLSVHGVGVDYLEVNAMTLHSGRFFTAGEVATAARVMILGKDPVEALFPNSDPIGRMVRLRGQPYVVIGTFVSQGEVSGMNIGQDGFCVIPYSAHRRDVSPQRRGLTAAMIPSEGASVERMCEDATQIMRVRHRLRAHQEDDFDLITQASVLKLWREISTAIFLGLLGISSIALVVGGIGVTAVMMVAVTERTREIGMRRAVGAKRPHILAQFLTEAVILAALGGAIGSALGGAAAWALGKAVDLPVSAPWDTFALAVGATMFLGLLFGVLPAYRAARLNIVEALRRE